MAIGLGRLRLGLGLDRGLWEKSHVTAHPTESEPILLVPSSEGQSMDPNREGGQGPLRSLSFSAWARVGHFPSHFQKKIQQRVRSRPAIVPIARRACFTAKRSDLLRIA